MTADAPTYTVAVVGGGLAGIAAAWGLAQAGIRVELFEAKRRLGGRAGSFIDESSSEEIDYCQHVGMACCTNLRHLVDELGLADQWEVEPTLHFYAANGRHLPLRASPLPAPLHMAGLLARWPGISWSDRAAIGWAILKLMRMPEDDPSLDGQALQWLRDCRQSGRAIDHFWRTILVSALGELLERVALRPARKVILDGFAANREGYRLLVPRQPLSAMFGGRAAERLQAAGVQLRTGCGVESIRPKSGGIELRLLSGETICYDAAVLAVAWHRVAAILSDRFASGSFGDSHPRNLRGSPVTGLHTWWDRPWLDHRHAILCDSMTQWVFAKPDGEAAGGEIYYQIVISGSHDFALRQCGEIEAALKDDLRSVFPRIASTQLLRARGVSDPRSVFSVAIDSPRHRWPVDRFASQNLWLAGDWTATGWPATMEGAIRSGYLAASCIAKSRGQSLNLPRPDLPPGPLVRLLSKT